MKLIDSVKEHPEKYFLPRIEEVLPGQFFTFYDTKVEEVNSSTDTDFTASFRVLKKKVFDGVSWFCFFSDHVKIYWQKEENANKVLIAEVQLVGQIWTGDQWQSEVFNFTEANVSKIVTQTVFDDMLQQNIVIGLNKPYYQAYLKKDIPILSITNAVFGQRFQYAFEDIKQIFYLDIPGQLVRLIWQGRYLKSAKSTSGTKGLSYDWSDYAGEVNAQLITDSIDPMNWQSFRITFEPDGYQCPDADDRTALERFDDGVGLLVDPSLTVDEDGTYITVTTDGDEIVFTIATENAIVIENTVARVWIREDYFDWFIYPTRMFRFRHDTGASTTGMSGNSYSAVQISGELYWYPLTSTENTNESTITAQLQDTTLGTPTDGSHATDLIIPDNLGSEGFANDGAWHFNIDETNENVKFTLDITRNRMAVMIHDFPFYTGDPESPTDHLLNYLKLDDNAASSTLTAEVGANATWRNISDGSTRNTNTSGDSVQVFGRGRNLDTQNGAGYASLVVGSSTIHDNAFLQKGSILFSFKPQFAYNDAASQIIFELYQGANDYIRCYYSAADDQLKLSVMWGGTAVTIMTPTFTDDISLQRIKKFLAAWDSAHDLFLLAANGAVIGLEINEGTPTSSEPSSFFVGCLNDRSLPADIIVEDIKTFDGMICPFGAYHTDVENSYVNPHTGIQAFVKGDEANSESIKIGTGTIVSTAANTTDRAGNSSGAFECIADADYVQITWNDSYGTPDACRISFWFKSMGAYGSTAPRFFSSSAGSNYFDFKGSDVGSVLALGLNGSSLLTSGGIDADVWDGFWHYLEVRIDEANSTARIFVDRVLQWTFTSFAVPALGGATYLEIGNVAVNHNRSPNGIICDFHIVSLGTPKVWTIDGKPRLSPLVGIS